MKHSFAASSNLPADCPGSNLRKVHRHLEYSSHASISVAGVFYGSMQEGEAVRNYRTPAAGFVMVTKGAGTFICNGAPYTAVPHKIIHVGKDMILHVAVEEAPLEYFFVMYHAELPEAAQSEFTWQHPADSPSEMHYDLMLSSEAILRGTFEQMLQAWVSPGIPEKLHTKKLFYELIYHMFRQLQEQLRAAKTEDAVTRAIQYMNDRFMEPLTADSLAAYVGYSTGYLSQLFKTQTGYSPIDYLIRVRINRAKELMAFSNCSMREVAALVGYADASYFSRIFKKVEGVSPHRYKFLKASR